MGIRRIGNIGQSRGTVNPALSDLAGNRKLLHLRQVHVNRHQPTFRVNLQVVLMIAVVGVALAAPLTALMLGIRNFSSKPRVSSPDTSGLRLALEQAAEKSWHPPEAISDGRAIFLLSSSANASEARRAAEHSARKYQGVVLSSQAGQQSGERLLVRIPEANANLFESETLRNFTESQRGSPQGESRLYEFLFPAP